MERFYDDFPADEDAELEGWIVEPPSSVKQAAASIQDVLRQFDWLDLIPAHFLHVWLGIPERLAAAPRSWSELELFEIGYWRLNCFHSAVVVEVAGPVRQLVEGTANDVPEFLPHMTIAVTNIEHDADELRETLAPLRQTSLGGQTVLEARRVRFPAAQSTLLRPWDVVETVSLRQRAL